MASVVLKSLFVAVCLQAATSAELPLEECEPRGALSAGPSDALVCTARGDWLPVGLRTVAGDFWLPEPRDSPDCTGKAGEELCDTTCSLTGVCLNTGQWLQTQNCTTSGEVCRNGQCGNEGGLCGEPGAACYEDVGVTFPSLVDCSGYYECIGVNSGAAAFSCPDGLYYDACTGECDIEASGECSWAVSNPCAELGDFGVAPNNDRVYYVCLTYTEGEIVPWWRKCKTGHFNTATLECDNKDVVGCVINNNTTTTTSTTTTIITTTTTTTSSTTTSTSTTGAPTTTTKSTVGTTTSPSFKCQSAGIATNPSTNCSYYYCYPDDSFILIPCRNGYHFELASKGCIYGTCTP